VKLGENIDVESDMHHPRPKYWKPVRLFALFALFSLFALLPGFGPSSLYFLMFLLFLLPSRTRQETQT
jgi:hypothetical protein